MEQSIGVAHGSNSTMLTADESEVLEILAQLPQLILESEVHTRFPFSWGCKRRRSAIDVTPSPPCLRLPSLPTPSPLHLGTYGGGAVVGPTCETDSPPVVKAKASSPATPLSFSPSESDEKHNLLKRKIPLKRKRDDYLKIIEELTKRRELLQGEIENVKRYYDDLKAFNLKLKARKKELSLGPKRGKPCLEMSLQVVHGSVNSSSMAEKEDDVEEPQFRMPNTAQHVAVMVNQMSECSQATTSLASRSILSMVNDRNMGPGPGSGPLGIPDLNVCPEESIPVDSCQPFQLSMANKHLSRVMAAQARQKRIQIYRVKNSMGINKPRYSYR